MHVTGVSMVGGSNMLQVLTLKQKTRACVHRLACVLSGRGGAGEEEVDMTK